MENNIGERIKQVMISLNIKASDIVKSTGVSSGYLSNVLAGRKNAGIDLVFSLWETYKINTHWLLTGEGDMFGVRNGMVSEMKSEYNVSNEVLILQARLEECRETVLRLSGNANVTVLTKQTEKVSL